MLTTNGQAEFFYRDWYGLSSPIFKIKELHFKSPSFLALWLRSHEKDYKFSYV